MVTSHGPNQLMGPRTRILFCTDAGPQIGLGHLRRCLSLAAAFAETDAHCEFVCAGAADAASIIETSGWPVHFLERPALFGSELLEPTLKLTASLRPDAVVVDSYAVDPAFFASLRELGTVVALDDLGTQPVHACEVVVNGGAHAENISYGSEQRHTMFLLGTKYALLHPEFWHISAERESSSVRNVLITTGGADVGGVGPAAISAVDAIPGDFDVTVIVGLFSENREQIEREARKARHSVQVVHAPPSMLDWMMQADLAICCAGQTVYELAATGTSALALCVADNQVEHARALEKKGAILTLNWAETKPCALRDALSELIQDADRRAAMSSAGRGLVDGKGALRVAAAILERMFACR